MRYKAAGEELSRTEKRYRFAKWCIFALMLLFFYVMMRAGIFGAWQPVLLIPLAAAVSMFEDELSSCIFALFCGLMTDIAFGFVFGFSAVWLMSVCVVSSLLVRNLIRVNLFNFCVVAGAATVIEFAMDYLFNVAIWNIPKGEYILFASVFPTAAATFILSPAVYLLVRTAEYRLRTEEVNVIYDGQEEESTPEREEKT